MAFVGHNDKNRVLPFLNAALLSREHIHNEDVVFITQNRVL
jgi:hypothetical protein